MRIVIHPDCVKLWVSARETAEWARRPGAAWPCSALAGKRFFAEFDRQGLVDLAVDGRGHDVPADEFNAICADMLRPILSPQHACYAVVVGQSAL